MGLRFRKRILSGKLFRINVSTSGVSLGLGPPGLNVNIGPRGIRRTVGIPGTGIYYQDTSRWPRPGAMASQAPSATPPAVSGGSPTPSHFSNPVILIVIVIAVLIGI